MSVLDVRLEYQKETGLNLETIDTIVDDPVQEFDSQCPECHRTFHTKQKIDTRVLQYMHWLEEKYSKWNSLNPR